MNQHKTDQENLCLKTMFLIDKLRTNLSMIEDFKNYDYFSKKLKRLKIDINNIYWDI